MECHHGRDEHQGKIFEVAKFCVNVLGLHHPKEKTKEKILQTMLAACNPSASAQDCKDCLKMLSQCIDSLREINKDKRIPITEYGSDPTGFINDWPDRYAADHLPVPSKVTAEQLHFMSLSTVCRNSSKKLKLNTVDGILDAPKDNSSSKSSSNSMGITLPTHQTGMQGTGMNGNMQMMYNMMQFMNHMQGGGMQGNAASHQHGDAPADATRPSRDRSRYPLALLDGAIGNPDTGATAQQHGGALAGQGPSEHKDVDGTATATDEKIDRLASLVGSVKTTKASPKKDATTSAKKASLSVMKKPAACAAASSNGKASISVERSREQVLLRCADGKSRALKFKDFGGESKSFKVATQWLKHEEKHNKGVAGFPTP